MLKNAIAYAKICSIYAIANICKFLHMRHNFYICDFENAIICGKICDMQVFGKICDRICDHIFTYNQHP